MQYWKYLLKAPLIAGGAALLGLSCVAGAARAADDASDEAGAPAYSLSGFGSVGLSHSSERRADYSTAVLNAHGVGYTSAWSGELDSRLGVQLDANAGKQWSAVLQVIAEQRIDGSYTPLVEWANIKYQATPELALRFGRIALPMFVAADYRKVGYAYAWARTPVEVYQTVPVSNSDGVDMSYRWQVGRVKNLTQAFFGHTVVKLTDGQAVRGRHMAGVSHTADLGALSVRLSLMQGELTGNLLGELFGPLRQFGPAGAALAARYELDHKRANAYTVGVSYDPGSWFVMSELGHMETRSFLGATRAAYVSAGLRRGDFTPYLSFARVNPDSPTRDAGLDPAGLPPQLAPAALAMNGYLNAAIGTVPSQRTLSAGTRWDLRANLALKLQYDRVLPRAGTRGTLINVQPDFEGGHPVHVASAVLDFVF
ncbi:MAG: porin [Massilia sp.]